MRKKKIFLTTILFLNILFFLFACSKDEIHIQVFKSASVSVEITNKENKPIAQYKKNMEVVFTLKIANNKELEYFKINDEDFKDKIENNKMSLILKKDVVIKAKVYGEAILDENLFFENIPFPLLDKDIRDEKPETKTIKNINTGEEITYNPNTRKIVTLTNSGDLLAFGITPLAVSGNDKMYKEVFPDLYKHVDFLENTQPFSYEEIAIYSPELILVYDQLEEHHVKELEKLAPVIPIYRNELDYNKRLNYLGEIFNLEDRAKELINFESNLKKELLNKKKELNFENKELTCFYFSNGIAIPPTNTWVFNYVLYDLMQLKRPDEVVKHLNKTDLMPFTTISYESIHNFITDGLIFCDIYDIGDIPKKLKEHTAWQKLAVVKNNKVGILNAKYYVCNDILYLPFLYKGIMKALKETL